MVGNTGKEQLPSMVTGLLENVPTPTASTLPNPIPSRHSQTPYRHSQAPFRHSRVLSRHSQTSPRHSREGGNPQPAHPTQSISPSPRDDTGPWSRYRKGATRSVPTALCPRCGAASAAFPPDTLVSQINERVDEGFREVVLTGTQLGTYGFDLPGTTLTRLLERILAETGVDRLRVSSLQAHEIDPPLLELWQDPRMCPHFHIPLQERQRRRAGTYAPPLHHRPVRRNCCLGARRRTGLRGHHRRHNGLSRRRPHRIRRKPLLFPSHGIRRHARFPLLLQAGHLGGPLRRRPSAVREEGQGRPDDGGGRKLASGLSALRQLGQTRPVLWESRRVDDGGTTWRGLTDNYIRVYGNTDRDLGNSISLARLDELDQREVAVQPLL